MSSLVCSSCGEKQPAPSLNWRCKCGGLLDLDFTPSFPIDQIRQRQPGMWRYREALPISEDRNIVSFGEGFTPMAELNLNGHRVLFKQDHLFPTGSYKDRGASVLVSRIKELGIKEVVEDSSGNAGTSVAAYCAKAGIGCTIYVPESASSAKLLQISAYGATLEKIPGSREDTAAAVQSAAQHTYYASHVWNPYFFHGTKTFAFEVAEQLDWKSPDTLVLPAGNGTLLLGAYLGFRELAHAGVTEKIPKIIAVQAANCDPLFRAFTQDASTERGPFHETMAEGIAIAEPARKKQILEAVKITGGHFISVTEEDIRRQLKAVCGKGYFIEPTSASVVAGAEQYTRSAATEEIIVSVFTGHGLKSASTIGKLIL